MSVIDDWKTANVNALPSLRIVKEIFLKEWAYEHKKIKF